MDEMKTFAADLLSRFAGQVNTISIPRPYIEMTGSLEAALLLNQIIYWSDRTGMRDGWFAKSYQDWQTETSLSKYQVMKQIPVLKEAGVETQVKRFNGSPTVHYRLNKAVFSQWIVEKLNYPPSSNSTIHHQETSQSSTETTTETTTKEKSAPKVARLSKSTKQYPTSMKRWNREHAVNYWRDNKSALDTLATAWGRDLKFCDSMSKFEMIEFIETYRDLMDAGVGCEKFESLAVFTRAKMHWKGDGMRPTEMVKLVTQWRESHVVAPAEPVMTESMIMNAAIFAEGKV